MELPGYLDDIHWQVSLLRSAGTMLLVMQMATSSTPVKALSSKPSFANTEDHCCHDQHLLPRDVASPREPFYPNRELPTNARLGHVRSSYGVDERDNGGPYQTSQWLPKTHHVGTIPQSLIDSMKKDIAIEIEKGIENGNMILMMTMGQGLIS